MPAEYFQRRGPELARVLAEKGESLQLWGRRGQSAQALNALAEGLAILACFPGGVQFLGLRFSAAGAR